MCSIAAKVDLLDEEGDEVRVSFCSQDATV